MSRPRPLPSNASCRLLALTLAASAVGCATAHGQAPLERLTIVAPAAPGGGWDQTARAMQRALEAEGLVRSVQVENVPGAAGTIGLAQFINDPPRGEPALLVTGLVMVGALVFNGASVSLAETAPIAALTGEYEVIVVPAASPVRNMRDLTDRFRANPASVSWGGGSAGGTDHILVGLIAAAAGVNPGLANYIAFSGGGEAVAAVLGGQVTAGVSGYSEFEPQIAAGRLRALAISAPSALPGIDARPLADYGLNVTLSNWRGVVAAPGISDDQRQRLSDVVSRMVRTPSWQKALSDYGWTEQFLRDRDFERFLTDERVRLERIVRSLRTSDSGRPSPARLYPTLVMIAAFVVGGALVFEHRRPRARAPREPAGSRRDLGALGLTALALVVYPAALVTAGFVIASTILFWIVAVAFGSPHRLRDGAIALAFASGVHVIFAMGLGVPLPAGWLAAWIR